MGDLYIYIVIIAASLIVGVTTNWLAALVVFIFNVWIIAKV